MTEITKEAPKVRLMSLDALRGFDMFWIIGGSGMVVALVELLGFPDSWVEGLTRQMDHVKWDGFRFYDLIFPLFVFISGVTVPYSILTQKSKGVPVKQLQLGIIKRSVIIVMVGLSFSFFNFEAGSIRLYTVLWLIGMSYLIGASLTLQVESWKQRLIILFSVLVVYHLAMQYLPYPGKGNSITPENNLAAWVDRNFIPTHLYFQVWDPEGTIRVLTGGMLGLLGALIGQRIKSYKTPDLRCSGELLIAGLACLLMGWIWSFFFPIIKSLWSPSFILWAGGWSLLLLSLFYTVIDVWGKKWIGWMFVPIGMNAITIYAAQWYVPLNASRNFFFKGFANLFSNPAAQQFILYGGLVLIQWLFLYFLYRKKIFIRI
jgi:predicted acyltransferase